MEKIDNTVKIHAQIITFLIIWGVVLLVSKTYMTIDLWSAIKKVPQAISLYALIGIIFTQWIWRWKIFRGWLIRIPDLHGTWRGELISDWKDLVMNQKIGPISAVLVIKQTFSTISCTLMTKELISYSTTASISYVPSGGGLCLTYNYTGQPKMTVRDRSSIHEGAAVLRIVKNPALALEGGYWTSRKTIGDMKFQFESRKIAEKFD